MASIIESIQNDMRSTQLDYLRILAILFKTYVDNHTAQINANRALSTLNYFSNQLDKALKASERGKSVDLPIDISRYRGDMQADVLKALENNGIKYAVFPTSIISQNGKQEIKNFLVTENTPKARAVLDAIRSGKDQTIENATKVVALDMNTFAQQNASRKCFVYDNLNEQQMLAFKEVAKQNNFTFGLANKEGKYSIAVPRDIAYRYCLDQFAYECRVFNKSGIANAMLDLEAMNRNRIKNDAIEKLSTPSNETQYYVDLSNPAHYVEVTGNTITVHSENEPAKSYNAQDNDLRVVLETEFEYAGRNQSQMVEVGQKEFVEKYKESPLNPDALLKFVSDEVSLSQYKRHAIMVEQICELAKKSDTFQPQTSILKNLDVKARQLPESDAKRKELEVFISSFVRANKTQQEALLKNPPAIMTSIEINMLKRAVADNLSPTEFVYGAVMMTAENIAKESGDKTILSLFTNNAFDTRKIEEMLKTQDAIGSGFVASGNTDLADKFTKVFTDAVITTSQTELTNNANYLGKIRDAMVTVKATEVLNLVNQCVDKIGDKNLSNSLKNPKLQTEIIGDIKKILSGASLEESGLLKALNVSVSSFGNIMKDALDTAAETPNISISKLSKMSFFSEISGDTLLSDIVEEATIEDMMTAEHEPNYRTETTGDLIAGANSEFSVDDIEFGTTTDTKEYDDLETIEF